MKYYICKFLMILAFITAIDAYFERVYEVAIFFVMSAILFQLISMEKKEEQPVEYIGMNHEEIDEINSRL